MGLRHVFSITFMFLLTFNADASQVIYKNAKLIDTKTQTIKTKHILVESGKIIELLSELPQQSPSKVIDLKQQYVLPGFIDMHVHSWGNSSIQDNYQWIGTSGALKANMYSGVFAVLDLFSDENDILSYRDQQSDPMEAQLFAAGPCITATNGHCSEYDTDTRIVDTPEEAIKEVKDLAIKKPDVIKLVYDTASYAGEQMPTISKETMQALVHTAKQVGIKTVVHVGTWQDIKDAALAGADMATHLPLQAMPADIIPVLQQTGLTLIPTVAVLTEWSIYDENVDIFSRPLLQAVTTKELRQDYQFDINEPQFSRLKKFLDENKAQQSYQHIDNAIKQLNQANIPILVGTDAGNLLVFQGYSFHREMAHLAEAGMSNWQVLHAATFGAANMLNIDWGVEVGKPANFIVLEHSPIEDIQNTESIVNIVKQGQVLDRESIQKAINPGFWQMTWMYLTGW